MCTMIAVSTAVRGSGKGAAGWFPLTQANVGYDHATHGEDEHALLVDFVNADMGPSARVAVELDIAPGSAASHFVVPGERGRVVACEMAMRSWPSRTSST